MNSNATDSSVTGTYITQTDIDEWLGNQLSALVEKIRRK
jgi:hypothetical protein